MKSGPLLTSIFFICLLSHQSFSQDAKDSIIKNGFDVTHALIPHEQIMRGGPPRDGIPSIDQPRFVKPDEATFLTEKDKVLGVVVNGAAKAYPIRILNWHEIVNDRIGGHGVVITYCPLCGSGMAFSTEVGNGSKTFGVSGLLYNSDVLLYDRETQSLWSQIMTQAVAGPLKGKHLQMIPTDHTTWAQWQQAHPDTWVLSENTGFTRNYKASPYTGYESIPSVWFPLTNESNDYQAKTWVIGIEVDGKFKAYPFPELKKIEEAVIEDKLNGKSLIIHYDKTANSAFITDTEGEKLNGTTLFWFAWYAFHPDTEVFDAKMYHKAN